VEVVIHEDEPTSIAWQNCVPEPTKRTRDLVAGPREKGRELLPKARIARHKVQLPRIVRGGRPTLAFQELR